MIVSVQEARDLLGKEALNMSDEEITQLVLDMDIMARYALQEARRARKEDAMALARLIYDIYKDKPKQ